MSKKAALEAKREKPTVKELIALRDAIGIKELDSKIAREQEKKSKNIESIFVKKGRIKKKK